MTAGKPSLLERACAHEKAIAEVAQKIEPLRPRLLGNNQIQIDSIADIPEQDDCVCADKQARKPALRRKREELS